MRPSASARASVRIEIEVERCACVLRHPSGELVLDYLDEIGHTRPQCGVRLAFLQRRGQIDFRQRRIAGRRLRLLRFYAQPFEPDIVGAPLRRRLHLVA